MVFFSTRTASLETRPQKCAAGFCVGGPERPARVPAAASSSAAANMIGSYAQVGTLPLNVSDRADGRRDAETHPWRRLQCAIFRASFSLRTKSALLSAIASRKRRRDGRRLHGKRCSRYEALSI